MANILHDAIAQAKEVKAAALANAKIALEETFQPTLQRMISGKLAEEDELEDDSDINIDVNYGEEGGEDPGTGFGSFEDEEVPEEGGEEIPAEEDGEEDLEMEALIRELEGEDMEDDFIDEGEEDSWTDPIETVNEEDEMEDDFMESFLREDDEMDMGDEDEMVEAILREIDNLGDLDGPNHEDGESFTGTEPTSAERNLHLENRRLRNANKNLQKKLNESLRANTTYKTAINEVNLLNAKLMYTTKVIRQYELSEAQQIRVLEGFDRAKTVREVKLIYTALSESFNKKSLKPSRGISEGLSSKRVGQVNPKSVRKNVLSENVISNKMADRFQELAGIKSTDGRF